MIPFQLHRRLPLLRRPFFQRDQALAQRDRLAAELEHVRREKDQAVADLNALMLQRASPPRNDNFVWLLNRKPAGTVLPLGYSPEVAPPDDSGLVGRIITAYRRSCDDYRTSGSAWDHELWEIKRDIHDRLLEGRVDRVAALLRDPAATTLFWGFDAISKAPAGSVEPHELVLRRLDEDGDWMSLYSVWIMDAIRSLAEAIGASRIAYPEIDRHTEVIPQGLWAVDAVLDAVDAILGFPLIFPNPFPNELGLPSSRGIVGFRAVQAIYQAWRVTRPDRGRIPVRLAEVGAGLGRTAYYTAMMGVRDYTIVDIPLTNVAQAYFLGRTLGSEAVCLFGEDRPGIRIMPPSDFLASRDRYDLVLNVDSLTEMAPEVMEAYCAAIAGRSDRFLSINHEYNPLTVRQPCANHGMVQTARYPYWMRRGYVEEIFQPAPPA